jgi:glycosyltransferase involved in cell wall biosynthesis
MISIITPVYNGEKYIASCIQTVIDQNCPCVEHIIVDGNSTDNTINLIREYAVKHQHIRWISEEDRGQSDAMNKGVAIASGEVISFLNVDDYYEPNVLNRIVTRFKTLPEPSFVVGNCNIWNSSGEVIDINQPAKLRLLDLVLGLNVNPFPCNPCAYFYHRSLHDHIGYYAIDDHHAMDLDFILRAVQVAQMHYVNETWGNYRRIEGTKTFIDMSSGNADQRTRQLLRKYRKQLNALEWSQLILWKISSLFRFALNLPRRILRRLLRLIH